LKASLRKQVAQARDGLAPEELRAKSREIGSRLFQLPEYSAASVILFFASFRSEVETGPMIRQALAMGKRVVLPKVQGKELGLFEIKDFDADVSVGAWGIHEPHEKNPVALDTVDLIIVPGLAFDERGNRLGYGAGFYDKLLATFTKTTAALAYEVQVVPNVPAAGHDVPIQKIVTEKRIITAQRAEGKAHRA
jgi:5-formyltetrahydrofolate cyclo-ligase